MSFTPHSDGTSNRESLMADALRSHIKSYRKMKLNDFIESCGLPPISEADIDLFSVSEWSRRRYIAQTQEVIEVVLRTLSLSHAEGIVGGTHSLKQDARGLQSPQT